MIHHSVFDIHYSKNGFLSGIFRYSLAAGRVELTEIIKRGFSWYDPFTRGWRPWLPMFCSYGAMEKLNIEYRIMNAE